MEAVCPQYHGRGHPGSRLGTAKCYVLALSGGVDTSVAAALLATPCQLAASLTCIFVDHGLMRKDEGDQVEAALATKSHGLQDPRGSMPARGSWPSSAGS